MTFGFRLRFVRGRAWDSRLIEWQTRSWTSHVEYLSYDGTETFGAQLKSGVCWRRVNDPCYRAVEKYEVWEFPTEEWQRKIFLEFMNETSRSPYDWRAIVSFAFGERDWREPGSWFCSELMTRALEKMQVIKLPGKIPMDRITPRDLYILFTSLKGCQFVDRRG